MSTPKRWLEDPGGPGDARSLLQAGLDADADPPPGAQSAAWAALLTKIPPPVGPAGGAGAGGKVAASAAKAASAGLLKSALLGAGSAVALIATYAVVAPTPPATPPPPAAPMVAASEPVRVPTGAAVLRESPAPSAPSGVDRPSPAEPPPAEPKPASAVVATSAGAPPVDRETRLREESRLLGEARDALRRGDAPGALGLLDQLRARFPGGSLSQEREMLSIEALSRSGRRADAAARASAFLRAYPESPFGARVQTFANAN